MEQSCEYQFLEQDFRIQSVPEPYGVLVFKGNRMKNMLDKDSGPNCIGGK